MTLLQRIRWYLGTRRCITKDCKRRVYKPSMYCSYECACYDQVFNVKTGWDYDAILKKHPNEARAVLKAGAIG